MAYWPIYAAELVLWVMLPFPINGGVPLRMKCLSVRQPWAWAICSGEKRIENRTWSTNFRGTIAIHAGSSKVGINELRRRVKSGKLDESAFPLGTVIGIADIVDCVPLNEQLEEDPWAQGPMCWILENARRLGKPIPMKGKLNLFSLPIEVAERVESQLDAPCRNAEPVDSQLFSCLLDPPEERSLIQLSAYVELNQMDQVLRLANRYISRFPKTGIGYRFRAVAHCHLGDGGAAIADANRAIDLDPQDAGAHCTRAIMQCDQGEFVAARSDWERAKELGADLPPFDSMQFDDVAGSVESMSSGGGKRQEDGDGITSSKSFPSEFFAAWTVNTPRTFRAEFEVPRCVEPEPVLGETQMRSVSSS